MREQALPGGDLASSLIDTTAERCDHFRRSVVVRKAIARLASAESSAFQMTLIACAQKLVDDRDGLFRDGVEMLAEVVDDSARFAALLMQLKKER